MNRDDLPRVVDLSRREADLDHRLGAGAAAPECRETVGPPAVSRRL